MTPAALILAAVILGAVQGATEFLPVSSTAHLVVLPQLMDWSHPLLNSLEFDVAVHLGTLVAVLIVFGKEWLAIIPALTRPATRRGKLGWGLVMATLPALAAGGLLSGTIATHLRTPSGVAGWLVIGAIALWYADSRGISAERRKTKIDGLGLTNALIIGFAQTLALLPGMSRSGMTITAGMLMGLSRREALRYSFLLSTPVIAAACIWEARHIASLPEGSILPVLAGVGVSGLVGAAAIRWLLDRVPRIGFGPFVVYRFLLAAVIWAWPR